MSTGEDLRVYVILHSRETHMVSHAATAQAPGGESWRCRCGVAFKGEGAIANGRKHDAETILAALDEATGGAA